jgi:putative transcriptional regulator
VLCKGRLTLWTCKATLTSCGTGYGSSASSAGSQAELGAALGVSRQTVISIESGRYLPSLPLAFRIARFFDVTVDKMFDPGDEVTGS